LQIKHFQRLPTLAPNRLIPIAGTASVLTMDAAQRLAINYAKWPELLKRGWALPASEGTYRHGRRAQHQSTQGNLEEAGMEGVPSCCVDFGWLRCLASYTPLVESDFAPHFKTVPIATLGATPLLTKLAAVASLAKRRSTF